MCQLTFMCIILTFKKVENNSMYNFAPSLILDTIVCIWNNFPSNSDQNLVRLERKELINLDYFKSICHFLAYIDPSFSWKLCHR